MTNDGPIMVPGELILDTTQTLQECIEMAYLSWLSMTQGCPREAAIQWRGIHIGTN